MALAATSAHPLKPFDKLKMPPPKRGLNGRPESGRLNFRRCRAWPIGRTTVLVLTSVSIKGTDPLFGKLKVRRCTRYIPFQPELVRERHDGTTRFTPPPVTAAGTTCLYDITTAGDFRSSTGLTPSAPPVASTASLLMTLDPYEWVFGSLLAFAR